ncbi:gamma-glutamylcyclotransferase family protein [Streptomyces aidingensis]|uniref:Putative gamma-glutamylcyclotransferase n=1 Tax=Streptomyces aidingensis TaxID=910347 RepID=A0A1I1LFA6_9ACTN|nr:gamma-glutamylcyclotransferase family protein [Streptomyces aidingensis]SFC68170.1 Gamma-glutamyl cyclotransferase, AIG2-like [Streptomyces aidingensis]
MPPGERDGLFVYGTLRFPEVLRALLGRVPERVPAAVRGWRAAALDGRAYPGLVPRAAAVTEGALLRGLAAADWAVLDRFEGDEYRLARIPLAGAGEASACAYLWAGGAVRAEDWDAGEFATRHLARYVARLGG